MTTLTHDQRYSRHFVFLLALFGFLGPLSIDMYLSSFPHIADQLNASTSAVQATLTASFIGLMLGQIYFGPISDAYGRTKPILYSMVLYVLASIACAVAPSIVTLIIARVVQGFAMAGGFVISRAIVRDKFEGPAMTAFMALLTTIGNAGPLVAPLLGSYIADHTSWRYVFLFTAVVGAYLAVATRLSLAETLAPDKRIPAQFRSLLRNYGSLLRNREFMGYALSSGVLLAGIFGYVAMSPFIYQEIYHVSPAVFGMLFATNGVSLLIGSFLVKHVAGHLSETTILKIGLAATLVTSVIVGINMLMLPSIPLPMVTAGFVFYIMTLGFMGPASFTLAMEPMGNMAGTASAVLGILPFFFGAIAPPLVGLLGPTSTIPLAMIIVISSIISVLCYIVLVRK